MGSNKNLNMTGREVLERLICLAENTLCTEVTDESVSGFIAALEVLANKSKDMEGGDIADIEFEYTDFDVFNAEQYFDPIFEL